MQLKYDNKKVITGINKSVNAVKVTAGPKGATVIIEGVDCKPVVTKDGVSVAREITLTDKFENMGAELIKEVAEKTAKATGDGTTSASILAQALIVAGIKNITAGANATGIRNGINKGVKELIKELKTNISKPVKDLDAIASISANDRELGKIVADTIRSIGQEGYVSYEDGDEYGVKSELIKGLVIDRGVISPRMIMNADKDNTVLDKPYVVITDHELTAAEEIYPILAKVQASGKKELLIIADDISGMALAIANVQVMQGILKIVAIKTPGYGADKKERLLDIATATKASIISKDTGMKFEQAELKHLGQAGKVIANRHQTVIMEGIGKTAKRIKLLREQIKGDKNNEDLKKRLARLQNSVAILKVGAATEQEAGEIMDRLEDAVCSSKAALDGGMVVGGGVALIRASKALDRLKLTGDEATGLSILCEAITEPLKQIARNADVDASIVYHTVVRDNVGYNAETGEYGDLISMGVIDATKVVCSALENAASTASLVLSTKAVIVSDEEKTDE